MHAAAHGARKHSDQVKRLSNRAEYASMLDRLINLAKLDGTDARQLNLADVVLSHGSVRLGCRPGTDSTPAEAWRTLPFTLLRAIRFLFQGRYDGNAMHTDSWSFLPQLGLPEESSPKRMTEFGWLKVAYSSRQRYVRTIMISSPITSIRRRF